MGVSRRLPKSNSSALFLINRKVNDICINKLNIHNKSTSLNRTNFNIYAYSYCPIDNNLNFSIYFNKNK